MDERDRGGPNAGALDPAGRYDDLADGAADAGRGPSLVELLVGLAGSTIVFVGSGVLATAKELVGRAELTLLLAVGLAGVDIGAAPTLFTGESGLGRAFGLIVP